jgi:hypothetical protein
MLTVREVAFREPVQLGPRYVSQAREGVMRLSEVGVVIAEGNGFVVVPWQNIKWLRADGE